MGPCEVKSTSKTVSETMIKDSHTFHLGILQLAIGSIFHPFPISMGPLGGNFTLILANKLSLFQAICRTASIDGKVCQS